MEFQKLINRAMDLRTQYEKKEKQLYGSPSTDEDIAQGLLGDANNLEPIRKSGMRAHSPEDKCASKVNES